MKHKILRELDKQVDPNEKHRKGLSYTNLLKKSGWTGTGFSRTLRELGSAGLIDHPNRNLYRITYTGEDVNFKLCNTSTIWSNPYRKIYSRFGSRRSTGPSHSQYYQPETYIKQGTQKGDIVESLASFTKQYWWELEDDLGIDAQNLGKYLRRMEYAGIVERPARGVYRLTPFGEEVALSVEREGYWRDE